MRLALLLALLVGGIGTGCKHQRDPNTGERVEPRPHPINSSTGDWAKSGQY